MDFTNARKGSRILDVSTGTGKQAFVFAKKGYNIISTDLPDKVNGRSKHSEIPGELE